MRRDMQHFKQRWFLEAASCALAIACMCPEWSDYRFGGWGWPHFSRPNAVSFLYFDIMISSIGDSFNIPFCQSHGNIFIGMGHFRSNFCFVWDHTWWCWGFFQASTLEFQVVLSSSEYWAWSSAYKECTLAHWFIFLVPERMLFFFFFFPIESHHCVEELFLTMLRGP